MNTCLFCRRIGEFKTREHIVPESLGNDSDLLINVICEKCQNYFGTEVERQVLEKTPIAFWRSYLGIKTKEKEFPSVNLDPPFGGAIPSHHPLTEYGIGFTAHEDGTTEINVNNEQAKERLFHKLRYNLVLTPWHLSLLGRFLGKIGLEYVALNDVNYAMSPVFDKIRTFSKKGSTKHLWPIYWGRHGELKDLKSPVLWKSPVEGQQEIQCYSYSLGELIKGGIVFSFLIGIDIFLISLTDDTPDSDLTKCIDGVVMNCVHYPDRTWG